MATTTIRVRGMTCDHCVRAVHDELARIPDVTGVEVDLDSGTATIVSAAPVSHRELRAAVEEAGYELIHDATHSDG